MGWLFLSCVFHKTEPKSQLNSEGLIHMKINAVSIHSCLALELSKRNLERSTKTGSRACSLSMNCWGMRHDNIIKSDVSLQWHTKPAEFKTAELAESHGPNMFSLSCKYLEDFKTNFLNEILCYPEKSFLWPKYFQWYRAWTEKNPTQPDVILNFLPVPESVGKIQHLCYIN